MQYFDLAQLATLAGATLATVLIVNVLRLAFGFSARWVALAVAAIINLAVWAFSGVLTGQAFFLAILNACVVYLAATGGNQIVAGLRHVQPTVIGADDPEPARPGFWAPWW